MANRRNYQRELDVIIQNLGSGIPDSESQELQGQAPGEQNPDSQNPGRPESRSRAAARVPRLLLHSCCAPCSSYVLEYLSRYFEITDFFYNPNITSEAEYRHRAKELRRLIAAMPLRHKVDFVEGRYEPREFYEAVRGLEREAEGGARCFACYELRLREAARLAAEGGYDYFTTTLSISPLKNAEKINEIGERLAREYGVSHLPSDFKKKGGYQRSIELSREYELYRQNYCGCVFSRRDRRPGASPENAGS